MASGVWYSNKSFEGRKICKAVKYHGDGTTEIVGISDSSNSYRQGRLPASYLIPQDDPQYSRDGSSALGVYGYMLNSRSWVYDAGLALLVFTHSRDYDICVEMQARLASEQNDDGSFNFSYDLYIGQLFEGYVRTGAIGWLVWGMCYYILQSGDRQFIPLVVKTADWLVSRQITTDGDPRYGLLTGGYGAYDVNYAYTATKIEWCSIEHNCSSLQALHGAALVTGDTRYRHAADLIKSSLIRNAYDKKNKRFYQGIRLEGPDVSWAVDCCTWAGKQAMSIVQNRLPSDCADTTLSEFLVTNADIFKSDGKEHYNNTYYTDTPVDGLKPYSNRGGGYDGAPELVWTEGTLGYCALQAALGNWSEAKRFVDEVIKIQNCHNSTGGVLYVTKTYSSLPWEFHVWESVVSSAWLYLVIQCPEVLFPVVARRETFINRMTLIPPIIEEDEDMVYIQDTEPVITEKSRIWIKPGAVASVSLENPYSGLTGRYSGKVAPHWYSTSGGGVNAYKDMQDAYRDAGYLGGIKTDRNTATGGTAQSGFILIRGCAQLTNEGGRVGVFPLAATSDAWGERPDYVSGEYPLRDVIDFYHQTSNTVCVAHHHKDSAYVFTKEEIMDNDFEAFEIYNAGNNSNAESMYDELLTAGKRLWCTCGDGCQDKDDPTQFNIGWIKVYYLEATIKGIVDAIRSGKFIACKQHDMSISNVTNNSITAVSTIPSDFELIANGAVVDRVTNATIAVFANIPADAVYVRVRSMPTGDASRYACSQPFYVTAGGSSGSFDTMYINDGGAWRLAVFE